MQNNLFIISVVLHTCIKISALFVCVCVCECINFCVLLVMFGCVARKCMCKYIYVRDMHLSACVCGHVYRMCNNV